MIEQVHYLHKMPSCFRCFGLYEGEKMVGVCNYGYPPCSTISKSLTGAPSYQKQIIELNRLVIVSSGKNLASQLISSSLRQLPPNLLVVSYADANMHHAGFVYQATNWLYIGTTPAEKKYFLDGREVHHRDFYRKITAEDVKRVKKVNQHPKHRYVNATGGKIQRKRLLSLIKHEKQPYPKSDPQRYEEVGYEPQQTLC